MIGDVIAERYEVIGLVGTGGMSSVYKAHDQLLERNVALKVLHPHYGDDSEYVERFRREARAVAQLSHPNIVTVIDRGEADGHQFIVFELIDGENLKELVNRTGPLPVRRAVELALAVAEGLAFAHEHGLVHRDVKPQNVLLNGDGEAKVTDFGIVRSLDVEHGVTQTGTVLGTSNYLSPEQASGKQVTPATDVYSLGVVLYELLTAEVPFPGDNFVAVAMKHLNDPVPDILERRPDVPVRLAAAMERALEKDPARRFRSMRDFASELRACLAELGSFDAERTFIAPRQAILENAPRRVRTKRRRRWPVLVVLVLLGAAAVVVGVLALGGPNSKNAGGNTQTTPPARAALTLRGVGAYDPVGGDGEHDGEAPNATDGNPTTYGQTEHYRDGLRKPGVGVVLDAGRAVAAKRLTVTSDTPGFTATILAGSSPTGPFAADAPSEQVGSQATFTLRGHTAEYYVVWITDLGSNSSVHVNEVKARS
jgi:eukaryotic-like serine/threonine-protein kinase